MAHFWKEENIQKHEDTTPRRKLNQDDIQFLKELQTELNTQNHCLTANPRYWGIKEKHKFPTDSDYASEYVLIDGEGMEYNLSMLYDDLVNYREDNPGTFEDVRLSKGLLLITTEDAIWGIRNFSESEAVDFIDYLNDEHDFDFRIVPTMEISRIRQDAFFLTQKAATEHLRRNAHNYTKDACTYCMHAHRCPEYERLLEILSTIDWSEVQNG